MNNIILREKRNGDSRFNEVVLNIDKNQQCKRGCIDSDPRKIMVGDIIKSDDQNFEVLTGGHQMVGGTILLSPAMIKVKTI